MIFHKQILFKKAPVAKMRLSQIETQKSINSLSSNNLHLFSSDLRTQITCRSRKIFSKERPQFMIPDVSQYYLKRTQVPKESPDDRQSSIFDFINSNQQDTQRIVRNRTSIYTQKYSTYMNKIVVFCGIIVVFLILLIKSI